MHSSYSFLLHLVSVRMWLTSSKSLFRWLEYSGDFFFSSNLWRTDLSENQIRMFVT